MTDVHITHIGGPTALIEVDGWRLLTDPTFDSPGRQVHLRLGVGVPQAAGPAIPAADIGPIDAVLLSHDHHADNLDDAGRALLPSAGAVLTTRPARGGSAAGERVADGTLGDDPAGGGRQADDRGHRHTVPARPTGQPADHR